MTTPGKPVTARHHKVTKESSLKAALRPILRAIGTPLSAKALSLLKLGDYAALAGLKVSPSAYTDPHSYFWDAQVCALFNKNKALPSGLDKRKAAIEKFLAAEDMCKTVNERLSNVWFSPSHDNAEVAQLLDRASRITKRILGTCPTLDSMLGRYGPGSNDLVRARHMRHEKYDKVSCTPQLYEVLMSFVGPPRVDFGLPEIVCMNSSEKITTVDKNSLTDRSIGITVSLNGFYQTALGQAIRRKLERYRGAPLEHLQDIHGALCKNHSNDIATIDLSMASDTVSWMIVRLLLPEDWFAMADAFRVSRFTHPLTGVSTEYQKFSAMGNGFTFELETLIFYAISLAAGVPRDCVSTYGDDIICTEEFGPKIVNALQQCGFTLNIDKSFLDGSFKESCGHDYFNGCDVRPYFVRDLRTLRDSVKLANVIRSLALWNSNGLYSDVRFQKAWLNVVQTIPRNEELYGPTDFGDDCIHASLCEAKHIWPYKEKRGGMRSQQTRRLMYRQQLLHPIRQDIALQQFLYERSSAANGSAWQTKTTYSSFEPSHILVHQVPPALITSEQEVKELGRTQRVRVEHSLTQSTYLPPWM